MKTKTKRKPLNTAVFAVIIAGITLLGAFLCILFMGSLISGALFYHPSYGKAEKMFAEDYEALSSVASCFTELEYESIYIPTNIEAGMMSVDGAYIKIEDTDILRAIATLMGRGYDVMGKGGNAVHFQRWSMLENGSGIAYSIDGTIITDGDRSGLNYLTRLKPLSEPGWYYYEEDYNKWRNRRN